MPPSVPPPASRLLPASATPRLGFVLGVAALAALALVPSGLHRIEGMGSRPAYAAGVAALMALWWLTEAVPIALTACVPLVLFPVFGVFGRGLVGDVKSSFAPFVDAYIFLFLGGMTIGAGMEQWGLHRRIAVHIMRAVGTDPKRLLLGMLVSTAVVSMWISNTATAVMMMPIGMAVIAQLKAASGNQRLEHFGSAMMLAIAYGANVGGIGTKIGTGTNSIFAGFVADKLHHDIGFLEYMAIGTPFVVIFLPVVWLSLWMTARKDVIASADARAALDDALVAMGPMSAGEWRVAVIFGLAALFWIAGDPVRAALTPLVPVFWKGFQFKGKHYEAWVAMSAAAALVVTRSVSLASLRRLPWSTLVLLGGSFVMASGIESSGLSRWIAGHVAMVAGMSPLPQIGLTTFATVLLSAVASNTATINVALNVLPPSLPLLSASMIGASCDFMLPAGTPPNAIVFGSGYIRLPTMIRTGFLLDLSAVIVTTLYCHFYVAYLFR